MFYLVIVAVILCILFKILNVNNSAEKSLFYCKNQKFLEEFLKRAPELELPYVPTRFWGFSGHIQTIIQVRTYIFICIKWIDLMAEHIKRSRIQSLDSDFTYCETGDACDVIMTY